MPLVLTMEFFQKSLSNQEDFPFICLLCLGNRVSLLGFTVESRSALNPCSLGLVSWLCLAGNRMFRGGSAELLSHLLPSAYCSVARLFTGTMVTACSYLPARCCRHCWSWAFFFLRSPLRKLPSKFFWAIWMLGLFLS